MPGEKELPDRDLRAEPAPGGGALATSVGRGCPMRPAVLRDGTPVALRDIRPEDEAALTALYERLSPQTAYQRFFTVMRRLPPNWGHILANVDYDRRMAIVALGPDRTLIGVARYVYDDPSHEAEIAIVIEDPWQSRGIGTLLLSELIAYAEGKGIRRFRAYVLADNAAHAEAPPAWHSDRRAKAGLRRPVPPPGAARALRVGHQDQRGRISGVPLNEPTQQ